MTTLRVDIDNKKSEKVVLAVFEALGLNYKIEIASDTDRPLNKKEQMLYDRLKDSFEEIKQHQDGKIKLKTIEEVLSELS
ncbi:hypothetical protein [Parapedobacter tibetensis]|uniref:hypothetical protein n=1 Tax=Parapedobacter tibetensis TaxID=2972951 RepID=UPI00214DA00A|nr:hypothetical protein [Parapedobacter tibetensis]